MVAVLSTLAVLLLAGLVGGTVVALSSPAAEAPAPAAQTPAPAPSIQDAPVEPSGTADAAGPTPLSLLADAAWAERTSTATGIPLRALLAYAGAELRVRAEAPACGLGWNTLAAIGYAESRHGTHDGSAVGADGTVSPAIFGIALAGGSTAHIPDSDEGAIDGDAEYDRAVGPMQLIPQTWRNWHADGNGDGVEDPQNIDDATLATANYLCRSSGDMTTEEGWRKGIAAYNGAESYIRTVAAAGVGYGG